MQLHFLGASYNSSPLCIDTVESEITGKFHGNPYKIRRPLVVVPNSVGKLKYRGITY
jgi:hypothetical protein